MDFDKLNDTIYFQKVDKPGPDDLPQRGSRITCVLKGIKQTAFYLGVKYKTMYSVSFIVNLRLFFLFFQSVRY